MKELIKFTNISPEAATIIGGENEDHKTLRDLSHKDFIKYGWLLDLLEDYRDFNVILSTETWRFVVYPKAKGANPKKYPKDQADKTRFLKAHEIKITINFLIQHGFDCNNNDFCKLFKGINFTWTEKGIIMSNFMFISYSNSTFVTLAGIKPYGQDEPLPTFHHLKQEGKLRDFGLLTPKLRIK